MTGTTRTSADLDPRRRKVLFRSWHRGMREMDLIMGQFADAQIDQLTDAELDIYEHLIEAPDRDILMWLTGEAPTPANYDTPVFHRIKAFHTHLGPINV
ncbi:hypothetical protein GCM10007036_16130 [Alsobacter metallidurans]|uniref:FAD assembly factor SdhE n=1 Tax=Alsobacter metallidurans TaxID=340221 RepID=A0A917I580_9HYPH|nr:succinate dehydrogenase assembly factor 2 [Alsobacter metallidurans]GGH15873.1 hypothetical protein GCM10007036_16130 [Alsobacter metallidurans]